MQSNDPDLLWSVKDFPVAAAGEVVTVSGRVYKGIGFAAATAGRNTEWLVVQIGTGHRITALRGPSYRALRVATKIAELTDWEAFSSIGGWENTDPSLPLRLSDLLQVASQFIEVVDYAGNPDSKTAVDIATLRGD